MSREQQQGSPEGEAIKEQITEAFVRRARADAGHIKVETTEGEVILRGHVSSPQHRKQAEETAWAAPGVRSVVNRLEVIEDERNDFEV